MTEAREIADRIKLVMKERRMTLRQLADATGLPYRTLQDYLLGETKIPAPAVGRIALALGVSTDWLILGDQATLDLQILEDLMETMRDILVMTKNTATNNELAKIFLNQYATFSRWRALGVDREHGDRPGPQRVEPAPAADVDEE